MASSPFPARGLVGPLPTLGSKPLLTAGAGAGAGAGVGLEGSKSPPTVACGEAQGMESWICMAGIFSCIWFIWQNAATYSSHEVEMLAWLHF